MSQIVLSPNAAGSAQFTLAAPDTNTNRTITLPDAAGTVLVDNAVPSLNGGQLAGMRNKIINGKMEIAQRGTSTSISSASGVAYLVDRFAGNITGSTGVLTLSQSTDAPAGGEFQNSFRATVTTADASVAAGDYSVLLHRIEGFNARDLVGRTFTLRFQVRSSKTGIHCVSFRNSGGDRTFIAEYTINSANTWEEKTVTVVGGLPTAGTWDFSNGIGLGVQWALMAGTNQHAAAGSWSTGTIWSTANQVNCLDTIGNIFAITGVQLEVGSVATPFEHRSVGVEELLCKRYTHVVLAGDVFLAGGVAVASTTVGQVVPFPVQMRAIPSLSTTLVYSYAGTISSGSVNLRTNNVFSIQATAGGQYIMTASSGTAIFSAEL